jgi:hypothetical protein
MIPLLRRTLTFSCSTLLAPRLAVPLGVVLLVILATAGTLRADSGSYTITGGFTTFSGNVDGSASPTYIRAFPNSQVGCDGPGCSDPLAFFSQICPDAGCSAASGMATNVPITFAGSPTSFLTFEAFSCPPSIPVCANTPNELDFVPANLTLLSFYSSPALLGTFTFSNGTWTGDADFGITITATDIAAPHNSYTFNGYIHMGLTPNDYVNNTPQQNADYVYLEGSNGLPVTNSLAPDGLGSVRAYELPDSPTGSNTVTFNLYGVLGSLDPVSFGDVSGGGFADISTTNALGGPPNGTVPEPASLGLLVAGILAATLTKFLRSR